VQKSSTITYRVVRKVSTSTIEVFLILKIEQFYRLGHPPCIQQWSTHTKRLRDNDARRNAVAPQLTVVTSTIAQPDVEMPAKDARAASVVPSETAAQETTTVHVSSNNDR